MFDAPMDGAKAARRIVLIGAAFLSLMLAVAAGLLAAASDSLWDLQVRGERTAVGAGLERALGAMIADVTSATVWDQAHERLRPDIDPAWAHEEIGVYMARNRGHELTAALDSRDIPFLSWAGGEPTATLQVAAFVEATRPLVARVRNIEAARRNGGPGRLRSTDPALAETASGVVDVDGALYFVAASTVVPEDPETVRSPTPSVVVVSGQRVAGPFLSIMREIGFDAPQVSLSAPPTASSVVLRDADGTPTGAVTWRSRNPVMVLLQRSAPWLLAGLAALGVVGVALMRQVRQITRRMVAHERDLAYACARAEAASVAKSQFLANMSHEIRTPLNGILGMAHVLSRKPLASEDREQVHVIQRSGELLLALMNDVLDISKIEAGKLTLADEPFGLADAVSAATEPFAAVAAEKGVRLDVEIDPDADGAWRGDRKRLQQVLSNLASNAVKFTAEGGIAVRARAEGAGLRFSVVDTGIGIEPGRLPHLFEKFVQADGSTTRSYGGAGLGLTICRDLVDLMGGRLWATSTPGRGSSFEFHLPLVRATPPRQQSSVNCGGPRGHLAGLRILAAEDNTLNQLLLTTLLEPEGAELRVVDDGVDALEAFETGSFDVVLMDIQMPRLGGLEATLAIRALETRTGRRRTPVLAVTAGLMPEEVREYHRAGVDAVVPKPVDPGRLTRAILDACRPETLALKLA